MTLANVALTDTFDIWRTRTNQLIGVYDETNILSRSAYNATNSFVSSTANLTANLITSNTIIMSTIYNNANTVVLANASNILFSNAAFVTTIYNNANTVVPQAVLSNTTVMNNIYNSANTIIASNAANIIYSNTIILTNFYNNANSLVDGYLANNNVTSILVSVNTVNSIAIASFGKANSFDNVYSTIAGANGAVGTGANAFATAAATAAATASAAGANAFSSATIAGANAAVGAGANTVGSAAFNQANSALVSANLDSVNATRYLVFDDTTTGAFNRANVSLGLLYNPSTNTLTTNNVIVTGNVGIGRSNPGFKLDVVGTINASNVLVNGAPLTASGGGANVIIDIENSTRYVTFANNTTGVFSQANVSTSLTFDPSTGTLSATIFNSTSDVRQKTNIESVSNALDVIRTIEGVKFDWVNTGESSYGVIAQEIERVLPELVKESNGIKSVNYSGIIAFLIQAVKELDEKIEKR